MTPGVSRRSLCTAISSRAVIDRRRRAARSVIAGVAARRRRPTMTIVLDALGGELAGDLGDGEAALGRLAAGHGHGVVEQQLVGDVAARRRRPARMAREPEWL